jgi:hypothetical protein
MTMGPAQPELALRASSLWLILLLGVTLVALSLVSMWKERHCPSREIRSEGQIVRKVSHRIEAVFGCRANTHDSAVTF